MARQSKKIDWGAVHALASSGIPLRELARRLNIPASTVLQRAKRGGWNISALHGSSPAKRHQKTLEANELSRQTVQVGRDFSRTLPSSPDSTWLAPPPTPLPISLPCQLKSWSTNIRLLRASLNPLPLPSAGTPIKTKIPSYPPASSASNPIKSRLGPNANLKAGLCNKLRAISITSPQKRTLASKRIARQSTLTNPSTSILDSTVKNAAWPSNQS